MPSGDKVGRGVIAGERELAVQRAGCRRPALGPTRDQHDERRGNREHDDDGESSDTSSARAHPPGGRVRLMANMANGNDGGRGGRAHGGNEPIPPFRDRFDVSLGVSLTERSSQHRDGAVEVGLLDKGVCPHFFQQPLFLDKVAGVFNEYPQEVEHPRCERDLLAIAEQPVLRQVEREPSEITRRLRHGDRASGSAPDPRIGIGGLPAKIRPRGKFGGFLGGFLKDALLRPAV